MVESGAIIWKIQSSYEIEYVVKNYDPSWVANPHTVTISPLNINPMTLAIAPVPAYDDISCPYVAPINWTQTKFVLRADGSFNTVAYVAPTTYNAQSSMVLLAYSEEIGAVAQFEFWTSFKNMWQIDPLVSVYSKITTVVNYVDGYQYL